MVGPISSEERTSTVRRVKAVFVLVVGLSGGLISLQAGGDLLMTGGAILAGLVTGVVLVWLVFPGTGEVRSDGRRGPPR